MAPNKTVVLIAHSIEYEMGKLDPPVALWGEFTYILTI